MFKYIIAVSIIAFCNAAIKLPGGYTELVLSQRFTITSFFYEYLPNARISPNEYVQYVNMYRALFDAHLWVIDGLWPYHSRDGFLMRCTDTSGRPLRFRPNQLDYFVRNELREKWPVLMMVGSEDALWSNDYQQYGSCVTKDPEFYFREAMRLLDKHDIGTALSNAHVYPDSKYPFHLVLGAIQNVTNRKEVIVRCFTPEDSYEQYLLEVRLCFNGRHDLQDCQHNVYDGDVYPCDFEGEVHFPTIPQKYL